MKVLTLRRWAVTQLVLAGLLALSIFVGLMAGTADIRPSEVLDVLTGRSADPMAKLIVLKVRLPRILLAVLVGGALSVAGVTFQALLRNPLADPFILGISGGAAFGAVTAITLGLDFVLLGISTIPIFSFAGAIATMFLIYSVSRAHGRIPVFTLLLVGVIFNAFFSAIIMFITSIVDFTNVLKIVFWLMGNLTTVQYRDIAVTAVYVFAGLGFLLPMAARLNLLSLGEEAAHQLGTDVERTKRISFFAASLVTAAAVSAAGMIGFVGLMVPHIVRLALGPDHRLVLPASALFGAAFLVAADTVARTLIAPTEIPVGVITAICGGPFFIWLLKTRQRRIGYE
ncbi:FecCD family ABC transporter permease [Thermodesulfobacteriota bacterium]